MRRVTRHLLTACSSFRSWLSGLPRGERVTYAASAVVSAIGIGLLCVSWFALRVDYDSGLLEMYRTSAVKIRTGDYGLFVFIGGQFLLGCAMAASGIRQKRRLSGLCLTCGYDLRASPERCPECGSVVIRGVTDERKSPC